MLPAPGPVSEPVFAVAAGTPDAQPELPLSAGSRPQPVPAIVIPSSVRTLARAVSVSLVEALCGRRPVHQLHPHVDQAVVELVQRLALRHRGSRVRIRSLHAQLTTTTALEVSLHLVHDGRSKAAALRFRASPDGWHVTDLEIALDPPRTLHVRAA